MAFFYNAVQVTAQPVIPKPDCPRTRPEIQTPVPAIAADTGQVANACAV